MFFDIACSLVSYVARQRYWACVCSLVSRPKTYELAGGDVVSEAAGYFLDCSCIGSRLCFQTDLGYVNDEGRVEGALMETRIVAFCWRPNVHMDPDSEEDEEEEEMELEADSD